jgi:hypothetical protein
MKITFVFVPLAFLFACSSCSDQSCLNQTSEEHGHTHYPSFSGVAAHKLIFPSKVPDRIIVNLTEDSAHSFAVNWCTDQQMSVGYVKVAKETQGPDFSLEGV